MSMKTIKVEITLAVDSTGRWNAIGWGSPTSIITPSVMREFDRMAADGIEGAKNVVIHGVEVEVPVPDQVDEPLQGRIVEGPKAKDASLE